MQKGVLIFAALLLAVLNVRAIPAADLDKMLSSTNPDERQAAFSLLMKEPELTKDRILLLIAHMKDYSAFGRSRPGGPDTTNTPVTDILINHGRQSFPYLLASLKSSDWNARRYSAFCLGLICDKSAVPVLQEAILAELRVASSSKISTDSGEPMPPTFVLKAMIEAYGRIDARSAFNWFLPLFEDEVGFRNFAANYALDLLVKDSPVALHKEVMHLNYKRDWQKWWKLNSHKPDVQLFEYSCQAIPTISVAAAKSDRYSLINQLFKDHEDVLLCEDTPCTADPLELLQKIAEKTDISVRPVGVTADKKFTIYNLNVKDAFIFLMDADNLSYRITDRTVTVTPASP